MSLFHIDPCDLLVVRDGRPKADASVGQSLTFPYPPTVAGGVRTRVGSLPGRGFVAGAQLDALKRVAIRGPLLSALSGEGGVMFPAPRDALLVKDAEGVESLKRLTPLDDMGDAVGDFIDGLKPVGLRREQHAAAKPVSAGAWWSWRLTEAWLRGESLNLAGDDWASGRLGALVTEGRLHVALGAGGTNVDGALFETRGLRLTRSAGAAHQPLSVASYALLVDVDDATLPAGMTLRDEVAPFGGERKLMRWSKATGVTLPPAPEWLKRHVTDGAGCDVRVVLATPGHFAAGARPAPEGALLRGGDGLTVTLTAMAVGRPDGFSGWDFAAPKGGRPKPSERVVSAGSVFWLRLMGSAAEREKWLARVWMQNVSDAAERRCDGLGLALVGKGDA
jgi:CRISPR-associated protein Cmr3